MKKVVRITEQELVSLIKKSINEVESGDSLGGVVTGFLSSLFGKDKFDELTGRKSGSDTTSKALKSNSKLSSNFEEQVNKVIDTFEGGYYNPSTMKSSGMGDSGETMMGIDRKHGSGFEKTSAGREFWKLIDDADAKNNWKYNYMGGSLEPRLRSLVAQMIKTEFDNLSSRYLSSEAQKIVKNNPDLMFHFIYGTWNGPGWFQKFAKKINEAVSKGVENPSDLVQIALDSRKQSGNSLIAKSGNKMSQVLGLV